MLSTNSLRYAFLGYVPIFGSISVGLHVPERHSSKDACKYLCSRVSPNVRGLHSINSRWLHSFVLRCERTSPLLRRVAGASLANVCFTKIGVSQLVRRDAHAYN